MATMPKNSHALLYLCIFENDALATVSIDMYDQKTSDNHGLKLLNFEDNQNVTHSLVRLLGTVETGTDFKTEQFVFLNVNGSKNCTKSEIFEERFKLFCELQQGSNTLTLTYCGENLTLVLNYCPNQSDYSVIPLYIICDGHDGKFQAPDSEKNDVESACQRINLASKLLQCFTAEKLHENGMGRKTFQIRDKCQIFYSKLGFLEARKLNERELWSILGREIMQSEIGSEKLKYLAFLSCTFYNSAKYTSNMTSHEEYLKITEGYVALGGGGLALFGTACLYTWPEHVEQINKKFGDETLVDCTEFLDDSCYRGTLGACFSTTLGSVLHELYHSFHLGHTEHGIMGRGFDNIYKFFIWPPNQDVSMPNPNKKLDERRLLKKSLSFKNQIEFKEEFEAKKLSVRLENENKKKEAIVVKMFEENDDTFLTRSCAVILCYHKWLNSFTPPKNSCSLVYDPSSRFIKSTLGIRLVEIRRQNDELVLENWTFEGIVLKFSFQIPEDVGNTKCVLFVEDSYGNILKENI